MLLAKHDKTRLRKLSEWLYRTTVIAIALISCCYIYAAKIEPNWIEVVPIELTIPNLSSAFDEFKIVQISDLHASQFMPTGRLQRIVNLVNRQQADAIAITGDIITAGKHFDPARLQPILSQLTAKHGNLAVLGNHDHWRREVANLKQLLEASQIKNLDNQVFVFRRGMAQLAIAGVDDPYWGKPDLDKVVRELPENTPAILLAHEPDYLGKSARTHRFALQLSGHSHGGQIRLPFRKPLFLPTGGRKYFAGLNQLEDTLGYTNRGLGMTSLPFRLNSRPEITVFTLYSALTSEKSADKIN